MVRPDLDVSRFRPPEVTATSRGRQEAAAQLSLF
jgi:hypothetical protein